MISNCGSDERGKLSGGQAGDQTGGEWRIRTWFNRPWNVMLRHPDERVRKELAVLSEKAARNDLVGYDQNQRTTYWSHLKASSYDPSGITIACEADCSSGILANVKAVGYRLGMDALKKVDQDGYTGNERAILTAAGFTAFYDSRYLTSDRFLLRGDVLLYEGHHTAVNLTDGPDANGESGGTNAAAKGADTGNAGGGQSGAAGGKTTSGSRIVRDGQIHAGNFAAPGLAADGIRGKDTIKAGVKVLQQAMNLDYHAGLTVDGVWGRRSDAALKGHTVRRGEKQYMVTALEILLMLNGYDPGGLENPGIFGAGLESAVRAYQKDHGLSADGIAGYNTFIRLIG